MDRKEETEAQSGTMSRVWHQEQLGDAEAGEVPDHGGLALFLRCWGAT